MTGKQLLIYGTGYTAEFIAKAAHELGYRVLGTSRQEARHDELRSKGIIPLSLEPQNLLEALKTTTHLIISYPPPKSGEDNLLLMHQTLPRDRLPHLAWIGYLSSTAVYGDHLGAYVTEDTSPHVIRSRGNKRLEAEKNWWAIGNALSIPTIHFRLSGIYGPYRNALTTLKGGLRDVTLKEDHYFSRIHTTDIAKIVSAAMERTHYSTLFNLADDEPTPSHVVYEYAARLLGISDLRLVPFERAELSEGMRDFYRDNRRISNAKVKKDLGYSFQFANYRDGLLDLFKKDAF